MRDPQNPEIIEYIKPTAEELKARNKRNVAIALGLAAFMILVFLLLLYKYGYLTI
jgi:hypothetical protein